MQLVYSPLGRHSDCRHKESRSGLNDNVNELRQLAVSVIFVGLSSSIADFGKQEIDSKRTLLVNQRILQIANLHLEKLGRVSDSSNHLANMG